MATTVEPCIYLLDATKTKPAGFHVKKEVRDQWGERRQVAQIFRPTDESEEARLEALDDARSFLKQVEREKRTGKIYQRWDKPTKKTEKKQKSKGAIAFHEHPEEEHEAINRDLKDQHLMDQWMALGKRLKRQGRLEEVLNGGTVEAVSNTGRETFAQFMKRHLAWYEENTSKSNFQKKRAAWNALKTFSEKTGANLTTKKIGEIRPSEVDDFVAWLSSRRKKKSGKSYYSKSSVKGYFALVRSFFKNWAAEEGMQNPATPERLKTDVQRLRGREATEKVPGKERLAELEKGIELEIKDSSKRYLHLRVILRYVHRVLMGTGMRISEALYLTDEHIDVDEMTLTIEGAVVDGEPGLTKTGKRKGSKEAGTRVIPMSQDVLDAIGQWIQVRTEHGYPDIDECNTIFCRRDGSYFTDDQIRSYYKRACSKAKMDDSVTPHDIRHSVNDRLRRAGVTSEVRQAIMGHADAETNAGYTAPKAVEAVEAINDL